MESLDSEQAVFQAWRSTRRSESDFRGEAKNLTVSYEDYERKLASYILLGNAAGLVLCAGAIASSDINLQLTALVLPSLWLFLVGVVAAYLGGVFFSIHLETSATKRMCLGNSQFAFLSVYDNLRAKYGIKVYELSDKQIADFAHQQPAYVVDQVKEANALNGKIDLTLKLARGFGIISLIAFALATLIPLIVLSLQFEFSLS